jgi:hypothetical protein
VFPLVYVTFTLNGGLTLLRISGRAHLQENEAILKEQELKDSVWVSREPTEMLSDECTNTDHALSPFPKSSGSKLGEGNEGDGTWQVRWSSGVKTPLR